jgi:uncharacterized membrane protein
VFSNARPIIGTEWIETKEDPIINNTAIEVDCKIFVISLLLISLSSATICDLIKTVKTKTMIQTKINNTKLFEVILLAIIKIIATMMSMDPVNRSVIIFVDFAIIYIILLDCNFGVMNSFQKYNKNLYV